MNLPPSTSEEIVQKQLEAYNDRNLDALVAIYSDETELERAYVRLPPMKKHEEKIDRPTNAKTLPQK